MYYVYILESVTSKKYYIGYTNNLETRLNSHNNGLQRWTRNKGPWKLVYSEQFDDKRTAILRERELKNKKSRVVLEYLINKNNIAMGG
ncbi:MAG: GIY-YIG nuclease family protein [Planctomycetes bacterium]|nr:GIY-YIG nuclease family protein [Planctomycetota bacterium]